MKNSRQLLPVKNQSDFQRNILDRMREDSVTHIVKQHFLILLYGQRQYEKVGGQQHNWQYISQKMKELGRFFISLSDANSDVKSLTQCFSPQMFDAVITSGRNVAGYDSKVHTFATPSLALKLGYSLQKCCGILRNSATRNADEDLKRKATDFLELYKDEWTERVSVHAHGTLSTAKYNRPQMLPLVEDVVLLHKYLEKASELCKDWDDESRYLEFGKICLCQIILCNRKRSGEAQRLKISDFNNGLKDGNTMIETEIKKGLNSSELKLCETHKRIETRGEKGRKVSLILTDKMEKNLKLLVDMRRQIHVENDHLFAKPRSIFPIRGCDALREMAKKSGAKQPSRITSTKLRMQLATLSQVLGLTPSNQDLLAKFMGHDIRVHRNIYQLHETTLELAKVTKVLHALNTGKLSLHAGKDFDSMMADPSVEASMLKIQTEEEAPDRESKQQKMNEESAKSKKKRRRTSPRTWTENEKRAVNSHMSEFFDKQRILGKLACENKLIWLIQKC
ncbi:uncharacterized protein LOC124290450 [Haliotis rubra]|uniref:uncharacterized protein LOC124290450 n=1 Tax=Haliotis rubra TaxID=36100 RepID=UPI001EE5EE2F|nr:uncharacterized protein LOC124290450 [Haliotis rubra]